MQHTTHLHSNKDLSILRAHLYPGGGVGGGGGGLPNKKDGGALQKF